MRSPYVIRKVDGERNRDLLLSLQKQALPADPPKDPSKGHWWIAYRDGRPAAYAGLHLIGRAGFLCHAGVLRGNRGHGLQRRLIQKRIALARSLGLAFLYSTTFDNPVSSNNLLACGFRMYTPTSPWGARGTNYWILRFPRGQV